MMMICKENREIALGMYEKVKLIDHYDYDTLPLLRYPLRQPYGPIYFNFELDIYINIAWDGLVAR
jgi:hypothetical protein